MDVRAESNCCPEWQPDADGNDITMSRMTSNLGTDVNPLGR